VSLDTKTFGSPNFQVGEHRNIASLSVLDTIHQDNSGCIVPTALKLRGFFHPNLKIGATKSVTPMGVISN